MNNNKDIAYIKHIRDAILDIEKYLHNRTLTDLDTDSMLLDAMLSNPRIFWR